MSALTHALWRPGLVLSRSRRVLVPLGATLLVALLLLVGYRLALADRVFPGVSVRGVDLGGRTRAEAAGLLTSRLQLSVAAPLVVVADSRQWQLSRAALGAHYDVGQLTALALSYGRTGRVLGDLLAPVTLRITPRDIDPSILLDDADWNAFLDPIATAIDRPAVDASLTIDSGHRPVISPEQDGVRLDRVRTRELLTAALLANSMDVVTLPAQPIRPAVRAVDLESARRQAAILLSGPVKITSTDRTRTLSFDDIQQALILPGAGASAQPRTVDVDPGLVPGIVARIAAEVDRPAKNAAIALDGSSNRFVLRSGYSALRVDRATTTSRIAAALTAVDREVSLAVDETPPEARDEDLSAALTTANSIIASDLVVNGPAAMQWTISSASLRGMVYVPDPVGIKAGTLPALDPAKVGEVVRKIAKDVDRTPLNARFQRNSDASYHLIRDSVTGLTVTQADSVARIVAAAAGSTRSVDLVVVATSPAVARQDVDKLGSLSLIAENSTAYGFSIPPRRHNVELATSLLNGVVVGPGEIFSFNRELGSTSLDRGFQVGYGIEATGDSVKTVPSVAGGICQVATTLFQPVFWEGYSIEERYSHAYWIAHYISHGDVGLDTTVDEEGGLDFQFKNDTNAAILIQSGTDGSNVHFAIYGVRPDWTVKVDPPKISNIVKTDPKPEIQNDPTLAKGTQITTEAAEDGFQVVVHRQVIDALGNVRDLFLRSSYAPSHNVVLVGTKV
jgi:vancomycin resistance protein YoaR